MTEASKNDEPTELVQDLEATQEEAQNVKGGHATVPPISYKPKH